MLLLLQKERGKASEGDRQRKGEYWGKVAYDKEDAKLKFCTAEVVQ